jgi:hypothetical protein
MFERNRIDNAPETIAVPVEIGLVTGEQVKGKLMVPVGRSPLEFLNSLGAFVEFEPYGGERQLLAKTQIAAMHLAGVPKSPALNTPHAGAADFDPYAILGVSRGCSRDEVRQAYLRLSKTYHPDCYSGVALPDEVKTYLETMARRLNAAYAALEQAQRTVNKTPMPRYEPIFTSPPRR